MIVAILTAVALLALAMFFVAWAKYLEEKEKAESIEKKKNDDIAFWKEANDDKIGEILFYHAEYRRLESLANQSEIQNQILQDKLSAVLCPTNNHVWINGVCKNCGRIKS